MAAARFSVPPLPWRWIPVLASGLVPRPERRAWLESRQRELRAWWTLVERGELASGADLDAAALCRRTLAGAMALRFPPARLREWAGSASFIVFLAAAVLPASAALTGGFAGARWLCKAACSAARSTRAEDAVAGVGFLVGFSVLTGFALILHARPAIARRGSRYWAFLALKTACAVTLLPLLWFEALYALRTRLPLDGLPALLSALGIAGALLAALGRRHLVVFRRSIPALPGVPGPPRAAGPLRPVVERSRSGLDRTGLPARSRGAHSCRSRSARRPATGPAWTNPGAASSTPPTDPKRRPDSVRKLQVLAQELERSLAVNAVGPVEELDLRPPG